MTPPSGVEMSNMTIKFWHSYNSAQTTDVPARESSLTVGTLRSTFYIASTDAQALLDAMWAKGMRPSKQQELPK